MPKHLEKFWTWCWLNVSCHNLYGWHDAWRTADKMRGVANIMRGTANTMHSGTAVLVFQNPTSLSVKVDEIA